MRQLGRRLRNLEAANSPQEARAKGIGASAISALMGTNYAQATINADRGQRSFNLSLDAVSRQAGCCDHRRARAQH